MQRVVIDINSVLPLYKYGWTTGIGRTTKELVEALDKVDDLPFEVMLYSQNTKGVTAKRMETHFQCRHLMLPHRGWMNRIVSAMHLREIATKYDLLHVPHNFEWVSCPARTIVTMHDTMFFAHPEESLNHEYAKKVYPSLASKARGIITCSESSKRDIMHYMDIPEEKIFVTPWGYRQDLFHPNKGKKTGYPYFLSVSCSLGRKNTMSVIKAYEQFAKNKPQHELVLVWPNAPQEALNYCNQSHLRNHIYITDDVNDERLGVLYNEATATFFPSRYEGFGLPVLESMACGTPVVTCRNSSLPEVGGEAALYVDPDDINGMIDIMEKFEQGTLKKEELAPSCLAQASKFSWQNCASKTVEAYKKCLSM